MAANKKQQELFQYVLILKKEKPGYIDIVSFLICFICWLFFIFYCYLHQKLGSALFFVSFIIPIVLARTVWLKRKQKETNYKHPLFATGITWLFMPGMWWILLLFLVFVLLDHQARQPLEVGVSDENIVINTFFRKRFKWDELNNVVLKDNLLTLDFTNNKILQKEILPYPSDANEKEFNEFCTDMLQKPATR